MFRSFGGLGGSCIGHGFQVGQALLHLWAEHADVRARNLSQRVPKLCAVVQQRYVSDFGQRAACVAQQPQQVSAERVAALDMDERIDCCERFERIAPYGQRSQRVDFTGKPQASGGDCAEDSAATRSAYQKRADRSIQTHPDRDRSALGGHLARQALVHLQPSQKL